MKPIKNFLPFSWLEKLPKPAPGLALRVEHVHSLDWGTKIILAWILIASAYLWGVHAQHDYIEFLNGADVCTAEILDDDG